MGLGGGYRLSALSLNDYPAIRMQDGAAEVGPRRTRQEDRRIRDVHRRADSLERDAADGALEALAPLHLLGHRRIDHARTDRVSGYVVTAEFERHAFHQHPDARLADAIFARTLERHLGRPRRDRDNPSAPALLDHLSRHPLAGQEHAVEID